MTLRLSLLAFFIANTAGPLTAQAADRPIRAIGEFSNIRYTEEHEYGYAVQLWRDGESLVGLFLAAAGLQGDTPVGLLENVRFNTRTGALSFIARLSTGVALLPDGRTEPARDRFEFTGILATKSLRGTLKHLDARNPPAVPRPAEQVYLKLLPPGMNMPEARSYAEWRRSVDSILAVRGPKW